MAELCFGSNWDSCSCCVLVKLTWMCQLKTRCANTTHNQQCVFTGSIYQNVAFFYLFLLFVRRIMVTMF